jgi:uncharacterized membrane protein YbhN (UPF0104 family)
MAVMKARLWRPIVAVLVLSGTITVFVRYFMTHPELRQQLRHTSPLTIPGLLVLYSGFVVTLALINIATIRLCRIKLDRREALLLTAYSSIINFFGPLQSGPAFRAYYLKKNHHINLKQYTVATFVYYLLYAAFSGILLLSGLLGWWLVLLVLVAIGVVVGLSRSNAPYLRRVQQLDLSAWYLLASATALQMVVLSAIYFVELHAVQPHVHLGQAIVYTGAANFALFVSLTPGAIGFRESFLVFSQRLHHISDGVIVLANTIDRATYLILLIIMGIIVLATHARDRFSIKTPKD